MSRIGNRYLTCPVCNGKGGEWSHTQDGSEWHECDGCGDKLRVERRHYAKTVRAYVTMEGFEKWMTRMEKVGDVQEPKPLLHPWKFFESPAARRFAKGVVAKRIANNSAVRERAAIRKASRHG